MTPGAARRPALTDGERLAETRERFLTAESVDPHQVRDTILASWWRSRRWNVAADHIDLAYIGDPDLDTPLTRSALPVLRHLREHLEGQPISVILTDAAGVVLTRLTADHDLDRHLDRVKLAPGFSYAEESVGTNGIGTALEGGRPMHVFGHEHYAENLEDLACAGVPIRHPISGKTLGAVDLTCWRKDADPLLITLAKTTADQITQALLTDSNAREFELLQEYLRACRHSAGIVLALNHDVVMMNDLARQVLDPGDQAVLLGQATEALASRHSAAVEVELPTGARARMYCRPLRGDDRLAGGVVHVKLVESGARPTVQTWPRPGWSCPAWSAPAPLWLRGCQQVEEVYDSGEWLALEGEPGVGKLALLRAVHQRRNPAGRFHVLDAANAADQDWQATARRELLDERGLPGHPARRPAEPAAAARPVVGAPGEPAARAAQDKLWVAVTLGNGPARGDLAELLRFFPSTVECRRCGITSRTCTTWCRSCWPSSASRPGSPARPRRCRSCCGRAGRATPSSCGRCSGAIVQHRRTGTIRAADLPPECWTVSRRLLSPLESMERDAIVQSLLDSGGNKVKAAAVARHVPGDDLPEDPRVRHRHPAS